MITNAASAGSETRRCSSVQQSRRSAEPARPRTHAAWSRIPHGTPTARSSARWQASASWSGSSSNSATVQSASPIATSSAAEDESPAPGGRSDSTVPTSPTGGRPSVESSAATPWPYRAQPVDAGPPPSAGNGSAAPKREESSRTSSATRAHPERDPELDRRRQHEAAAVVRVLADEIHPARRPDRGKRPGIGYECRGHAVRNASARPLAGASLLSDRRESSSSARPAP